MNYGTAIRLVVESYEPWGLTHPPPLVCKCPDCFNAWVAGVAQPHDSIMAGATLVAEDICDARDREGYD